jgi:hypothetical protein
MITLYHREYKTALKRRGSNPSLSIENAPPTMVDLAFVYEIDHASPDLGCGFDGLRATGYCLRHYFAPAAKTFNKKSSGES